MSCLGHALAATLAVGYCAQHPSSVNHSGASFHAGCPELPDFASTDLGTSPCEFLPKKGMPPVKSHHHASLDVKSVSP